MLSQSSPLKKRLLVVGCSATKFDSDHELPAVSLYDGPVYRILRSFLRDHQWPRDVSVGVLSAKHGLIGSLAPISYYDLRMSALRANELRGSVTRTFVEWKDGHSSVGFGAGEGLSEQHRS